MPSNEFPRIVNIIILATVSITPLIFLPKSAGWSFTSIPKVYAMALFAAAYLFTLLKYRREITLHVQIDRINLLLVGYFLLLSVSIIYATDQNLALYGRPRREEGLTTIMLYILLFFAARSFDGRYDRLFHFMLCASSIISVHGILQFSELDQILDYLRPSDSRRAFSTMGNSNFLGSYLVLLLPLVIHLFTITRNNIPALYIYGSCFSLLFYCLLCTQTRGSWLGAVIATGVYAFLLVRYHGRQAIYFRRGIYLLVLTIFLSLLFNLQSNGEFLSRLLSVLFDIRSTVTDGLDAERAGSGRIFIWKRVLALIAMKPWFGHGIENLHIVFDQFFSDDVFNRFGRKIYFDKAHNEYLHIAVTSGVPSLLLYLSFISFTLRTGFKRLESRKKTFLLMPIMASSIGYLAQAFVNISVVQNAYIFWIFLGILSGNHLLEKPITYDR